MRAKFIFYGFWVLSSLPSFVYGQSLTKEIVILGASILSGWGLDPNQTIEGHLIDLAQTDNIQINIINQAIPGAHSGNWETQIKTLKTRSPDLILTSLGLSDVMYGMSNHQLETNLESFIKYCKSDYPRAEIVLIQGMYFQHTIRPSLPSVGSKVEQAYREVFSDVCREANIKIVKPLYENIVGKAEYLQLDLLHPNPKGTEIIANQLWTEMKIILLDSKTIHYD